MLFAIRGDSKFEGEEFRSHLADLTQLESVGVFLGAGASVSAGGMLMDGLWKDFLNNSPDSADWLVKEGYIFDDQIQALKQDSKVKPPSLKPPQIEKVLDYISASIFIGERDMGVYYDRGVQGDQTSQQIGEQLAAECIKAKIVQRDLYRSVVRAAILDQQLWNSTGPLVDLLNEEKLSSYRELLYKLTSSRQPGQASPWIFSTNYDLAVEWAAESIDISVNNGFLGTHRRHFLPQNFDLSLRNTQTMGESRIGTYDIYHVKLHGSLNWVENSGDIFEIQSSETIRILHELVENSSKQVDIEKRTLFSVGGLNEDGLNMMVFPSAAKYIETTGYFYSELMRQFSNFVANPRSALIVVGYGFNDDHINRLIKSALLNPTFQLVICLPEFLDPSDSTSLPKDIQHLISLKNPRVTIIGGGEEVYFEKFVKLLPEPTNYNEPIHRLRSDLLKSQSEIGG